MIIVTESCKEKGTALRLTRGYDVAGLKYLRGISGRGGDGHLERGGKGNAGGGL